MDQHDASEEPGNTGGPGTPERERHRRYADRLSSIISDVPYWSAPTPVPEWSAADIVEHLLDWLPPVLRSWSPFTLRESRGDVAVRWADRAGELDDLLADPASAGTPVSEGPFAGRPTAALIDTIYTPDVYMHGLDLARAVGWSTDFDPGYAAELLAGMRQVGDVLRADGQFGPEFPSTSDGPVERLMAFIGRDPAWTTHGRG